MRPAWPSFNQPSGDLASAPSAPGVEVGQPLAPGLLPTESYPALPDTRAEDALNDARMEASRILSDAAQQAEAAQEEAYKQGYETGRQEGIEAGKADLELLRRQAELEVEKAQIQADSIRQMAEVEVRAIKAEAEAQAQAMLAKAREEAEAILEEARRQQHQRLDDAQQALVDLAVTAAMRLVQGHLALQPSSVVAMVGAGLKRLKDTNCTVRVHPQDLPLLEAQRSTLERELGAGALQLQPDVGISQGSYMLSSPQGGIDGRLETQSAQLKAALQVALGGEGE